jgi:predicted membrane-bound spermidine synthase
MHSSTEQRPTMPDLTGVVKTDIAADTGARAADVAVSAVVHGVFILSGAAALLYQMVWQRSLLILYGSNAESVALVVTAFMLGLGLGSLAGGEISKRAGAWLVPLFALTELFIGLYGLVSLALFRWVGGVTLQAGTIEAGLLVFALVLFPTVLMGSTLPLLVAWRVNTTGRVGHSVSWLYFVNTLGGALGAFLAGLQLLGQLGLQGSVQFAAALNVLCALAVFATWKLRRTR